MWSRLASLFRTPLRGNALRQEILRSVLAIYQGVDAPYVRRTAFLSEQREEALDGADRFSVITFDERSGGERTFDDLEPARAHCLEWVGSENTVGIAQVEIGTATAFFNWVVAGGELYEPYDAASVLDEYGR
jgi:hypothetical protein